MEEEQEQELPDIWKLPHQDGHLHLDGWDVLQLNDLRDVGQDAVQPAGWRLLGGQGEVINVLIHWRTD